ncbi:hypothetical protein [Pseudaestuariivita atlantica]|uniref:DUF1127 domain-containing protein n=1 Tax=Pseudaestuariivita atlantica TaxID=1317121 RepID=A0A0L1JMZ3_9RHOB|nr:hypothetical protein [Pseudaestuariivita atlantica]KNG93130.1 hypothetical protein ATO11_14610 [Pseudaestuariivita atlantica]
MTMMTTETPRIAERTFGFGWSHRILTWIEKALETPSQRKLRLRIARIEALRNLSDEALAARGLTRETISASVFADQV